MIKYIHLILLGMSETYSSICYVLQGEYFSSYLWWMMLRKEMVAEQTDSLTSLDNFRISVLHEMYKLTNLDFEVNIYKTLNNPSANVQSI